MLTVIHLLFLKAMEAHKLSSNREEKMVVCQTEMLSVIKLLYLKVMEANELSLNREEKISDDFDGGEPFSIRKMKKRRAFGIHTNDSLVWLPKWQTEPFTQQILRQLHEEPKVVLTRARDLDHNVPDISEIACEIECNTEYIYPAAACKKSHKENVEKELQKLFVDTPKKVEQPKTAEPTTHKKVTSHKRTKRKRPKRKESVRERIIQIFGSPLDDVEVPPSKKVSMVSRRHTLPVSITVDDDILRPLKETQKRKCARPLKFSSGKVPKNEGTVSEVQETHFFQTSDLVVPPVYVANARVTYADFEMESVHVVTRPPEKMMCHIAEDNNKDNINEKCDVIDLTNDEDNIATLNFDGIQVTFEKKYLDGVKSECGSECSMPLLYPEVPVQNVPQRPTEDLQKSWTSTYEPTVMKFSNDLEILPIHNQQQREPSTLDRQSTRMENPNRTRSIEIVPIFQSPTGETEEMPLQQVLLQLQQEQTDAERKHNMDNQRLNAELALLQPNQQSAVQQQTRSEVSSAQRRNSVEKDNRRKSVDVSGPQRRRSVEKDNNQQTSTEVSVPQRRRNSMLKSSDPKRPQRRQSVDNHHQAKSEVSTPQHHKSAENSMPKPSKQIRRQSVDNHQTSNGVSLHQHQHESLELRLLQMLRQQSANNQQNIEVSLHQQQHDPVAHRRHSAANQHTSTEATLAQQSSPQRRQSTDYQQTPMDTQPPHQKQHGPVAQRRPSADQQMKMTQQSTQQKQHDSVGQRQHSPVNQQTSMEVSLAQQSIIQKQYGRNDTQRRQSADKQATSAAQQSASRKQHDSVGHRQSTPNQPTRMDMALPQRSKLQKQHAAVARRQSIDSLMPAVFPRPQSSYQRFQSVDNLMHQQQLVMQLQRQQSADTNQQSVAKQLAHAQQNGDNQQAGIGVKQSQLQRQIERRPNTDSQQQAAIQTQLQRPVENRQPQGQPIGAQGPPNVDVQRVNLALLEHRAQQQRLSSRGLPPPYAQHQQPAWQDGASNPLPELVRLVRYHHPPAEITLAELSNLIEPHVVALLHWQLQLGQFVQSVSCLFRYNDIRTQQTRCNIFNAEMMKIFSRNFIYDLYRVDVKNFNFRDVIEMTGHKMGVSVFRVLRVLFLLLRPCSVNIETPFLRRLWQTVVTAYEKMNEISERASPFTPNDLMRLAEQINQCCMISDWLRIHEKGGNVSAASSSHPKAGKVASNATKNAQGAGLGASQNHNNNTQEQSHNLSISIFDLQATQNNARNTTVAPVSNFTSAAPTTTTSNHTAPSVVPSTAGPSRRQTLSGGTFLYGPNTPVGPPEAQNLVQTWDPFTPPFPQTPRVSNTVQPIAASSLEAPKNVSRAAAVAGPVLEAPNSVSQGVLPQIGAVAGPVLEDPKNAEAHRSVAQAATENVRSASVAVSGPQAPGSVRAAAEVLLTEEVELMNLLENIHDACVESEVVEGAAGARIDDERAGQPAENDEVSTAMTEVTKEEKVDDVIDLTWMEDGDEIEILEEVIECKAFPFKMEDYPEGKESMHREANSTSPTDSGLGSPAVPEVTVEDSFKCLCGKRAQFVCACAISMYCSNECQLRDWVHHQPMCKRRTQS